MTSTIPRESPDISAAPALASLDRYQPLVLIGAIGLGLGVAELAPSFADELFPLVSVGVFILIYLVMLGVNLSGVAEAFTNRRFLATATVINFVVNPLAAWALGATFLASEPDLRVGLILFLVTPCIGWYLIFTELAGGDARLGVSLLATNVVLQILLLPIYLSVFAGTAAGVDLVHVARSISMYLVVPAILAAMTRRILGITTMTVDEFGERVRLPYVKTFLLASLIVAMFASQADEILDNPGIAVRLLVPLAVFFGGAFCFAIVVGRVMNFTYEQTALLVFTTSSRNSEASLAVAATAFASPLVSLAVVIGPAIELPLLVLMVRALRHLRPGS